MSIAAMELAQCSKHHASPHHADTSPDTNEEPEGRDADTVFVQRERLELFVDLLWVYVVSNIPEDYFDRTFGGSTSPAGALMDFIVLFLPAWAIWSKLRIYLNQYYMDDLLQRAIIL